MERTMSMSSYGMKTDASKNSKALTATNSADRAQERELMALRRQLQQHRQHDDGASDTSSQRERKFANLLGASDTSSDRNVSPTNRNIGHRLYYTGCGRERLKQERLREERERLLMTEMAQMTQRPNITSRARSKPSKGQHFADHAAMWSAQRDHHLRRAAQQVAAERFAEVKEKPQLNPKSEAIVRNSGDYKGPVRHWDAHFEKYTAKHIADSTPPPNSFTPNINANAVRVDVERDIAERLYQESSSRKQRLLQKAHEQQARELIDPATGRPFFTPHSLRFDQPDSKRSPDELSAMLHEESFEVNRRRQLAVEAHPDTHHSFKPTINEVSATLAEGKRKPLYVPRAQRLQEEREKRERIMRSKSSEPDSSRPSTASPINVDEFLRRAQRNEMTRAQKLEAIRQEQLSRETNECTFHPAITKRSEDIFNMSNVSGTPMNAADALSPVPTTERAHFSSSRSLGEQINSPHSVAHAVQPSPPKPLSARPGGRVSTADDFAAVMAASGLSNAHQFVSTPTTGGRRGVPRSQGEGSPHAVTGLSHSNPADLSVGTKATTPRGNSQPAGSMGDVDQYIAAFESQMYSVLEEWRKLEEV